MIAYQRGSEWRRWDLHVHTASSYDYKYKDSDSDEKLIEGLRKEKISAVAITDHFVIDKKRIENLKRLAPEIVFFPGVELRTDKGASNIHVILIFSESTNIDILTEDFNVFKRSALNYEDNEKIYWDYRNIVEFAQKHDALISIHAGSKTSGIDDEITNALPINQAIKEEYANTISIFEMGKIKDLEEYKKHVLSQIGVKPMIICSDNHDGRNYSPKNKLWIKSDPTFNGLKQILYEPEERIRISDTKPEVKEDYYVIDRVEFEETDFPNKAILFNDKLTCIIGGKSTGKSILLQNMAHTIDPKEANKNLDKSQNKTREVNNLKVFWADGEQKDRKIIYIPQTYLNRLSDSKEEKTEIDQWVQNILFQKARIKDAYEKYTSDLNSLNLDLNKNIITFMNYNKWCDECIKMQKEIGDKNGIISTLKKLNDEKVSISKDLNISEEDINAYNTAVKNTQTIEQDINKLKQDIEIIPNISSLFQKNEIHSSISENTSREITRYQTDILDMIDKGWNEKKTSIIKDIENKISEQTLHKQKLEIVIKEKKALIDSSNALVEISKRIRDEEQKKKILEEKEKQLTELQEKRNDVLDELCMAIDQFKKINMAYMEVIIQENIENKDISFSAKVQFRREAFVSKLHSLYDIRNKDFRKIFNDEFSEDMYTIDNIRQILKKTINNDFPLKQGVSKEEVLRELFGNWYNTIYKVEMDGDTLDVMSPGKKALVLLKILVSLADSKCPILIDQPEDDLDNRSIYGDLINFIKEKKKERQIIIVTHNANIVVGADAEEVIVANQNGKNSPNKEFKFEYRSGSIENNIPVYKEDGTIDDGILNRQGIQHHICDILEGGELAFELRKKKYHI